MVHRIAEIHGFRRGNPRFPPGKTPAGVPGFTYGFHRGRGGENDVPGRLTGAGAPVDPCSVYNLWMEIARSDRPVEMVLKASDH